MSVASLAKRLAVIAATKFVESAATAAATGALTKVGEAIGARVAEKIYPTPPPPKDAAP